MNRWQVVHLSRGREWRGGERQVALLVDQLARGSGITQCTATGAGSRLAESLQAGGHAVLPLPWTVAHSPAALLALIAALRRVRRTALPLLLHAHDSHALALGTLAAGLLGLPLVATRRSMAPPGRLWRRPARVIAVSEAVAVQLREAGVPPTRITVVPSGIARTPREEGSAQHASTAGAIVAIGALTREKGHATLLEAFGLLAATDADWSLRLAGDGPERPALAARARALGLASRVRFDGEIASPAAWLEGAAVLVQPSFREALGTAVLEAMAAGVPVIASATGGLSALVGDGAGLLVPPGDAQALAAAIERLRRDPALAARIKETARRRVASYDAATMAERVVEVYRSALGDH